MLQLPSKKVIKNNLFEFFEYGNSRIPQETPSLDYSPENVKRIRGFSNLTNSEQHIAFELGKFRDKLARRRNKPSFFILTNLQLLELAKNEKPMHSILSKKQKFSQVEKTRMKEIIDSKYPNEPLPSSIQHFSDYPLLKQKLLTWRYSASKMFRIPKRLIISKTEIDAFDEKVYDNETNLLSSLWFTSQKNSRSIDLTNSFKEFLHSNEE